MNNADYKGLMVFAEQREGKIHPVSYELLGKGTEIAQRLGIEVSAVLLGSDMGSEINELFYYGAQKVYYFDHPVLRDFDLLNYKHNIARLVNEVKPETLLVGATHLGRSLAPRIAAAIGTGLTADCTSLEVGDEGNLVQIRPAFSGNIFAHIRTTTRPQMATVRYKVMQKLPRDAGKRGELIRKDAEIIDSVLKIVDKQSTGGVNIADADVIVCGGRGLKGAADFALLEDLAGALGGVVGCTRPVVDDGWMGKEHQVGFSGNTVKPKLYVAVGVSGSPQHLAGMRDSDVIVAINADPSAPIFKLADYGIVGDLYEVIPKLTAEARKRS
ncbi:MAG: electron transfer flavoprotein subunit alpha/FixB family protein [Dehalococcoidia bacterium]|jgi:electron transfer flavoprotein alpha subunit|nr:electron transfer flavoprotein subunit alpha/FixB family protein [Dehalococcoidia bacterium]